MKIVGLAIAVGLIAGTAHAGDWTANPVPTSAGLCGIRPDNLQVIFFSAHQTGLEMLLPNYQPGDGATATISDDAGDSVKVNVVSTDGGVGEYILSEDAGKL